MASLRAASATGSGGGGGAGSGGKTGGTSAPAVRQETEEEKALRAKGDYKRWGQAFKESGKGGEGLQVRDLLAVIEGKAHFGEPGTDRIIARGWLVKIREEDGDWTRERATGVGYGGPPHAGAGGSAPTTPGASGAR